MILICTKCKKQKETSGFIIRADTGKYRKQCRLCINTRSNAIRDKSKCNLYAEQYRKQYYEKCLEASKKWRKSNLEYDAFRAATYRATKLNQTPIWADKEIIKKFYLECPKGFHVDHIVPLKGKLVKGLHVIENLQYLPAKENLAKRNYYVI